MLTIVTTNGSVVDTTKFSTPYGGVINIIPEVGLTITVKDINDNTVIQDARVRMVADTGGSATPGDVLLAGTTDVNGELSGTFRYSVDQPITGIIRRATSGTYYKTAGIAGAITNNGLNLTIFMIKDE